MIKYFCDHPDCNEQLTESDPINFMLDVIGKVFCRKHLREYKERQENYHNNWISKYKESKIKYY